MAKQPNPNQLHLLTTREDAWHYQLTDDVMVREYMDAAENIYMALFDSDGECIWILPTYGQETHKQVLLDLVLAIDYWKEAAFEKGHARGMEDQKDLTHRILGIDKIAEALSSRFGPYDITYPQRD